MPSTVDPSLNRRKLRMELRAAREKAGLTQRQAADTLEWSLSKLIRIETGTVSVSVTDLRALIQLYGIEDEQMINALEDAARGSKGTSWWAQYNDVLAGNFAQYLGFESAATSIRSYHPIIIPGHLHTQDYALALLAPRVAPEQASRVVDLRMARQERIFEDDGPQASFVLDELALRRCIGDVRVMKHQLEQLLTMSRHPKVAISVLPADSGAHFSTLGSFVLLGFPDDDDLLYVENTIGSLTSGNDMDLLARYQECFETISARAVHGQEATELITAIKEELARR
jgi:transcriptional regulator with XRE-family HTH domain